MEPLTIEIIDGLFGDFEDFEMIQIPSWFKPNEHCLGTILSVLSSTERYTTAHEQKEYDKLLAYSKMYPKMKAFKAASLKTWIKDNTCFRLDHKDHWYANHVDFTISKKDLEMVRFQEKIKIPLSELNICSKGISYEGSILIPSKWRFC